MIGLVISDLHLSDTDSRPMATFCDFMRGRARDAEMLFILGDLFDAYLGDDCLSATEELVFETIAAATSAGLRVGVQEGNHDFLMRNGFYQSTGAKALNEYHLDSIGGNPALFLHGDQLCTEDSAYQELRRQLRSDDWQREFLAQTPPERQRVVASLITQISVDKMHKDSKIMNAVPTEIARLIQQHGLHYLVHGHTHSPGVHNLRVGGQTCQRIVLGTWATVGWYLEVDERPRLRTMAFSPSPGSRP